MSFLDQYDDTSPAARFPLVRGWLKSSPIELCAELRERRPILVTPECTLLALHVDVVDALLQPSVFTVQPYEDKMGTYLMAQDDTPVHMREKSIMRAMLNRDDLPRIRDFVGRTAAAALDAAADGELDAIGGLTRHVPIALVQDYMGFDGVSPATLARWSLANQWDTFHNQPFHENANADEIHANAQAANVELREYLAELVPRRIAAIKSGDTRDDIVSRLLCMSLPASVGFPMERLVRNIGGLLIGTVETTSQAAAQAMQELFRRPDALAKARAVAQDPARFDGYVFEALRFDAISPYLFRRAAADYVMARGTPRETRIAAGTMVLPLVQSAMFDPAAHAAPLEFRPDRGLSKAFHFGFGLHECLGRYIGEVMVPEIVRQVLLRQGSRPLGAIEYGDGSLPARYRIAVGRA
jgi:cytochrome P450